MEQQHYYFDRISLLITHYNRSNTLERLLSTFKMLQCTFNEIVVSDDGSKPEHLDRLKELQIEYSFKIVTSPKNKGLGHNINKGQDAVKSPYILYVQEDFFPKPEFPKHLAESLEYMKKDEKLDLVRFSANLRYPFLKPYKNGFSLMQLSPFAFNYKKIYCYSDHPQLRRSSFLEKFGRYAEGIRGDRTEYQMCISFIQKKGKGLFYNDYRNLFAHSNSENEPSMMDRSGAKKVNNLFIKTLKDFLRQFKYSYDILFLKL